MRNEEWTLREEPRMEFQIVCTRRSKSCKLLSVLAAERKRHWTSLSWTRSQRLEEFSLPLPWSFLGFSTLCTALSWRGWCLRGCRGGYFGRTLWARRSLQLLPVSSTKDWRDRRQPYWE